ncbi:hypothetical protein H9X85_02640 [Anaerotignum lactatifermentans]|uniref:Uncharacterized protein n=1 Tax=Anaerotignum lactatifermentans TaxID=160404 RepID=A0ABS2GAY9_9FIRM|nr:hypothetical protein [Anaerotignum lactatifermentans]MBM6828531.1 hypothetical protein [Anaerotignum lactatifermentans]MBM6877938.1 hypothetical protein [Anaerotignum lactatifermentans]MBM6950113.1 hypothetical protein [Anaerotignum lactatifermentans]
MEHIFTPEERAEELNKIYLEEDDLLMEADTLRGEKGHYILQGIATIEGERYHDFEIEFQLEAEPVAEDPKEVLNAAWDWYDFVL